MVKSGNTIPCFTKKVYHSRVWFWMRNQTLSYDIVKYINMLTDIIRSKHINWQVCEVVQQFSISGDGTVGDHVQL